MPYIQQILLQFLVLFENCINLNLKYIFLVTIYTADFFAILV